MTTSQARALLESNPAEFRGALPTLLSSRGAVTSRERVAWARLCQEAGCLELATAELREAASQAPGDPGVVVAQAALCQERGKPSGAARLLQRALDEAPTDEDLLGELVPLYHALGQPKRAEACVARAADLGASSPLVARLRACANVGGGVEPVDDSTPGGDAADDPSSWVASLADADTCRFAALFQGREDVFARQWHDRRRGTGYSPIREPLTPRAIRNHLLGNDTLGVYPIRVDGTVRWFAIDLDISKASLEVARTERREAQRLRRAVHLQGLRLARGLRELGFEPLLESSGYKGRHLWVFLERPEPAARLHELGRLLLALESRELPDGLTLEFFPRQATRATGKGLGNLIKLPLGIHRRSGRRSLLLDPTEGRPLADPWPILRQIPRASSSVVFDALARLAARVGPLGPDGSGSAGGGPSSAAVEAAAGQADKASRGTRDGARGSAAETAGRPGSTFPAESPNPIGPRPPKLSPGWTSVDFAIDPEVHCLTERCSVLGALRDQAEDHRELGHEDQVVLRHSLGHVARGVAAFNYLLDRCGGRDASARLQSPLRGSPISCARIRQRLPVLSGRVGCDCVFPASPDHYPTPLLHLRERDPERAGATHPVDPAGDENVDEPSNTRPPHAAPGHRASQPLPGPIPPEQLARRYGLLVRRIAETRAELQAVGRVLAEVLRLRSARRLPVDGGAYALHLVSGVEEIVWTPAPAAAAVEDPVCRSTPVSAERGPELGGSLAAALVERGTSGDIAEALLGPPPPLVPPPPLAPPPGAQPEVGPDSATDAA